MEDGLQRIGNFKAGLGSFFGRATKNFDEVKPEKSDRQYLKGKKQDIAEKNWEHQYSSYKSYLNEVKLNDWWIKVKCVSKGKLNSPEEIHNKISRDHLFENNVLDIIHIIYVRYSATMKKFSGCVFNKIVA